MGRGTLRFGAAFPFIFLELGSSLAAAASEGATVRGRWGFIEFSREERGGFCRVQQKRKKKRRKGRRAGAGEMRDERGGIGCVGEEVRVHFERVLERVRKGG
ncbi:hypothetical protein M9H77_09080 [Catharanthus roseus]|uniref:Uncharacterized protein n=1 Tax=Catharanthus roseus TaxID=4058 RepID=A0ACC0BZP8_CATRO|nr:hypothetical protein M9H77_09080 [Catharanthus roseus]